MTKRAGLFGGLYGRVMGLAAHRHAAWWLGGLSFAESSFFPIPPDVMLAPMTLARPARAWRLAAITTGMSVLGGLAGYGIGWLAIESVAPLIERAGYGDAYATARGWFDRWGVLTVLVAGFSPVPYKIFTIAAGALAMHLPAFVLMSALGRGARFFLVAGVLKSGGPGMEAALRRHIEWIGWGMVLVLGSLIAVVSVTHRG
jgi:membrane protein YqaA with SNARE-associated domain